MGTIMLLARHGETDWNKKGRLQGNLDTPLTYEGVKQAMELGKKLEEFKISNLYTSTLRRAIQTAEVVSFRIKKELILANELSEINYGIFNGTTKSERSKDEDWIMRKKDRWNHRVKGGESYNDVEKRVIAKLQDIIETEKNKTFVVITHEVPMRIILKDIKGLSTKETFDLSFANGELLKIDIENKEYRSI